VTLNEEEAYSVGGFSDVWKGQCDGALVALKAIRLHAGDRAKVRKVCSSQGVGHASGSFD
jgi:hypothetical protein